jgi:hypothetical protein
VHALSGPAQHPQDLHVPQGPEEADPVERVRSGPSAPGGSPERSGFFGFKEASGDKFWFFLI